MSRILMFAMAAALSMPVSPLQSPPAQDSKKPDSRKPAITDTDFLKMAADAGIMEVEVGRLAMVKASNADVKAYARSVVIDHEKANEELLKLSQSRNVPLNADALKVDLTIPPKSDHANMHPSAMTLMTLDGAAFDRAFIDQMVKDHQAAIDLFDEEADHGKDSELKEWAEKKHQTLQDHLKLAKDLQEKISR